MHFLVCFLFNKLLWWQKQYVSTVKKIRSHVYWIITLYILNNIKCQLYLSEVGKNEKCQQGKNRKIQNIIFLFPKVTTVNTYVYSVPHFPSMHIYPIYMYNHSSFCVNKSSNLILFNPQLPLYPKCVNASLANAASNPGPCIRSDYYL